MQVYDTTWNQIGRATKMACGAKLPHGSGDSLYFFVNLVANGCHKVEVKLNRRTDSYDIRLYRIRGAKVTVEREVQDIYAENLSSAIYSLCKENDR